MQNDRNKPEKKVDCIPFQLKVHIKPNTRLLFHLCRKISPRLHLLYPILRLYSNIYNNFLKIGSYKEEFF